MLAEWAKEVWRSEGLLMTVVYQFGNDNGIQPERSQSNRDDGAHSSRGRHSSEGVKMIKHAQNVKMSLKNRSSHKAHHCMNGLLSPKAIRTTFCASENGGLPLLVALGALPTLAPNNHVMTIGWTTVWTTLHLAKQGFANILETCSLPQCFLLFFLFKCKNPQLYSLRTSSECHSRSLCASWVRISAAGALPNRPKSQAWDLQFEFSQSQVWHSPVH